MTIPRLHPELWMRVFTHLDPASLSSLSEVNQTFHKCATDESLFRRHVLPTESTHPAVLYRRMQALHYPPDARVSVYSSTRTELLCVVDDTLVLLDYERSRIICFPSGLSVNIVENLENEDIFPLYLQLSSREKHVVLPGAHLGFMYDFSPVRFAVLHVKTGELASFPLQGRKPPHKEIIKGKEVVAAGTVAEWIAYYSDDDTIALVDWRSGSLVSEIKVNPNGVKYVMGECSGINGSSLVGLVHEQPNGSVIEIRARGFDGVEMMFRFDEGTYVHSVLRSADKKTYVVVTSFGEDHQRKKKFHAYRREEGGEKRWTGELSMLTCPELRENGHIIASNPEGFSVGFTFSNISFVREELHAQLWVELEDDENTKTTSISVPMYGGVPVWFRRTATDEGFALIEQISDGEIVLVKIVKDGQTSRSIRLRSWIVSRLMRLNVVADHFIVAQNRDGKIIVLHFDWFCHGATGIYACPGLIEEDKQVEQEEELRCTSGGFAAYGRRALDEY